MDNDVYYCWNTKGDCDEIGNKLFCIVFVFCIVLYCNTDSVWCLDTSMSIPFALARL